MKKNREYYKNAEESIRKDISSGDVVRAKNRIAHLKKDGGWFSARALVQALDKKSGRVKAGGHIVIPSLSSDKITRMVGRAKTGGAGGNVQGYLDKLCAHDLKALYRAASIGGRPEELRKIRRAARVRGVDVEAGVPVSKNQNPGRVPKRQRQVSRGPVKYEKGFRDASKEVVGLSDVDLEHYRDSARVQIGVYGDDAFPGQSVDLDMVEYWRGVYVAAGTEVKDRKKGLRRAEKLKSKNSRLPMSPTIDLVVSEMPENVLKSNIARLHDIESKRKLTAKEKRFESLLSGEYRDRGQRETMEYNAKVSRASAKMQKGDFEKMDDVQLFDNWLVLNNAQSSKAKVADAVMKERGIHWMERNAIVKQQNERNSALSGDSGAIVKTNDTVSK